MATNVELLRSATRHWPVLSGGEIQSFGSGGGLSGSRLWRISFGENTSYCLRRWPEEHPTRDRLRYIHSVLLHVSPRLPIIACPLLTTYGETFVKHLERLWELSRWLPGVPEALVPGRRERVVAALRAVAQFHLLAAQMHQTVKPAPAFADRQRLFAEAEDHLLDAVERALPRLAGSPLHPICRELLALARLALVQFDMTGGRFPVPALLLIPVIRDIHREHVLFEGDVVTGIIDFGAMRVDTPLIDIARLLGSLVGDDPAARKTALDAYAEVRELAADDLKWIDLLDRSGQVGASLNWLRWLCLEQRFQGQEASVLKRMAEIAGRLWHWLNQPVAR